MVAFSTSASISIVTPTLNAARYLPDCVASVRAQCVSGLQHFIVDGGSTDSTADIGMRAEGATWVLCRGARQSAAINEGLRRSSGDVVAWLNADDLYMPGALAFVLDRFGSDPDLEVLYGDCEVIGRDMRRLWWERPGAYDFKRLLRRGNYLAQPAVFLRRRVLEEIGYLDESLDFGMDYDLWLRMRNRRIEYVPRALARFRWHADSKSARGQMQSWNEFLRIVKRHGGGWTPEIAWAGVRCLITLARTGIGSSVTGSTPLRPLTRS